MHLPFLVPSMEAFGEAFKELYDKHLKNEYKDVKVLWLSGAPPNQLLTAKTPVRKLEDLKGMIVNSEGPVVPTIKALGASPTQVPPPELYTALQLGVIGGTTSPYAGIMSYRLQEVAKFLTIADVASITTFAVMNLSTWNSLPPDVKVALVTGAARGIGKATALALARSGAQVIVNDLQSCESAAKEIVRFIETAGGKGAALCANIGNSSQVESLFERADRAFGKLDILINNAGIGKPILQEVADAILFFASDYSRHVTGQMILVDGGIVMP